MNFIRTIIKNVFYSCMTQKQVISYVYRRATGKKMNWENPSDYNEKINWLKLYSDTTEWTQCADKYLVRDYISQKGFPELLVPLLGKWEDVDDIDFSQLPEQFVIKTNHGSGDVIIVEDKNKVNVSQLKEKLKENLKTPYGKFQGENHYLKITPCVLAEPLLIQDSPFSSSLVDYKFICFDGKPHSVLCFFNRKEGHYEFSLYDLDWHSHPEHLVFNGHSRDGGDSIPRPLSFDLMIKAASELSKGFPQVRVDFYEIEGKPYISELTFTSTGGCITYLTDTFLRTLGAQIALPINI